MKKKLTLSIERNVINSSKKFFKGQISEMVENFLLEKCVEVITK
jgi:hypothetical protein